ncbi:hypothetical protein ACU686_16345 [Yinghuangia aomiensis]
MGERLDPVLDAWLLDKQPDPGTTLAPPGTSGSTTLNTPNTSAASATLDTHSQCRADDRQPRRCCAPVRVCSTVWPGDFDRDVGLAVNAIDLLATTVAGMELGKALVHVRDQLAPEVRQALGRHARQGRRPACRARTAGTTPRPPTPPQFQGR